MYYLAYNINAKKSPWFCPCVPLRMGLSEQLDRHLALNQD